MTHEDRYKFLYEETERHLARIETAFREIGSNVGLALDKHKVEVLMRDDKLVAFLDQIAYRFSKIQDNIGKLIRLYLFLKGENVDGLPMLDVLNLAERYNLGVDKQRWFELRELRNLIVHEYEAQTQKMAETLNRIHGELSYLKSLMEKLRYR